MLCCYIVLYCCVVLFVRKANYRYEILKIVLPEGFELKLFNSPKLNSIVQNLSLASYCTKLLLVAIQGIFKLKNFPKDCHSMKLSGS